MNAAHGEFEAEWIWSGPNWEDMNDKDSSAIGWQMGDGLSDTEAGELGSFMSLLASEQLNLFTGPINFQDGSVYLEDGVEATDNEIWYTPQLLEGMLGDSE